MSLEREKNPCDLFVKCIKIKAAALLLITKRNDFTPRASVSSRLLWKQGQVRLGIWGLEVSQGVKLCFDPLQGGRAAWEAFKYA